MVLKGDDFSILLFVVSSQTHLLYSFTYIKGSTLCHLAEGAFVIKFFGKFHWLMHVLL